MILHAGIRPFIVSLLLLVHPGKNHPLPPEKRLTMTKKSCHDPVGNVGICMFKYDCIRQKGITLTTCVDGFLFGACCMLKGDQEDSGGNFISQSYSLLTAMNFLTTPSFSKGNTHSDEEISLDSVSQKYQTLMEEKVATTNVMPLSLTTKSEEDYLFSSSEFISANDNTESFVNVNETSELEKSTNSEYHNHSSSPILVTESEFKYNLPNLSTSNIAENINFNIESTTEVLNEHETASTSDVNILPSSFLNFTEEHTLEISSEKDMTNSIKSSSSIYFEMSTQSVVNNSLYTDNNNVGPLLKETISISASTLDISDNIEEESTTNSKDLTVNSILPNTFSNANFQNTNGNESDLQTLTTSLELNNDNARPFSHSPLNWVPEHIVPESFQSVIAQLTSNEMSSPLNNSHSKPSEVKNSNNTLDSYSQVNLTDQTIDDLRDGSNQELLYKNGMTTNSVLNNDPEYKQTTNEFQVIDSELFQDKNESLMSEESEVYSTFYDVMNLVKKVTTVEIPLTTTPGFSSSDKSNLTRNETNGATEVSDKPPIEIGTTQNPINSTYTDYLNHENSLAFSTSLNVLTHKNTESHSNTESYGESFSITLPDFNISTGGQNVNGSFSEENTDPRIPIQGSSIDLQDNILSTTLSSFEDSIILLNKDNSTEGPVSVQKEVQPLTTSSNLNAIVSNAIELPFKGTELPFDESITPSQTHIGSSHLNNSTKAEYISEIFYNTSPLDFNPLSSVTSNGILNNVPESTYTNINLNVTEYESYNLTNLSHQSTHLSFINSDEDIDIVKDLSLEPEQNFSLENQNDTTTSFNENYLANNVSKESDWTQEAEMSTQNSLNNLNFQSTQAMNLSTSDMTTHQTSTSIDDVHQEHSSGSDAIDLSINASYIINKISQNIEPSIPPSTISEHLFIPLIENTLNTTENIHSSNENGLLTTIPLKNFTSSPEDSFIHTSLINTDYTNRTEVGVTLLESNYMTSPNYNKPESSSTEHSLNITMDTESYSLDSSNLDYDTASSSSVHPSNLNSITLHPSINNATSTTLIHSIIDIDTVSSASVHPLNLNNESVSPSSEDMLNLQESVSPLSEHPSINNATSPSLTDQLNNKDTISSTPLHSSNLNSSTLTEDTELSYESASTLTMQSTMEENTVNSEIDSYQYLNSNGSSTTEDISFSILKNNQTTFNIQEVTTMDTSPQATPEASASTATDFEYTTPIHRWNYKKDCGIRLLQPLGRIVGGKNSYYGKWPWQALVKEATWLGLFVKNKCGGVLINAKYVLTAAHCQPGFFASLLVILGTHDLAGTFDNKASIIRNVKRMVVHRHYNAQTFENDLALLEMETKVEFLPHVVPICLPHRNEDFTGKMAFVTGWGKLTHGGDVPNILQEVQVPIVENEDCQRMFYHAGHKKSIRSNFVCAGYTNGGQDSCEGDSGGPLMVQREDKRWVLVGTVSHGIGCADPNLPGVYMRMSAYRPWIDSIIKKP